MADTTRVDGCVDQETESYGAAKSSPVTVQTEPRSAGAEQEPRTPLPKFQLFILFLIQFAEPVTAVVIYPFVNQFVRDTGITQGDDRKTGYYAGVIESAFFFAEAATVFQWGWLSDRFGRRPILLLGPLGLTFAMASFGYSTSFWRMVLSRCMQGIFNGNIGVSKTVMVELTDSSNVGDAFALIPLMWSSGLTLGPIIGGILSKPATQWPNVFGKIALFREYPYLLPCLATALLSLFAFVIGSLGLKETHPSRRPVSEDSNYRKRRQNSEVSCASSTDSLLSGHDGPDYGTTVTTTSATLSEAPVDLCAGPADITKSEPITLRSVLESSRMQLILTNYIFLCFTQMCYTVLMPLIYSTSIETGGLGLTPYQIGLIMGIWGFFNAFVQINLTGKFIRKYGGASVYRLSYSCYLLLFITFPFSAYLARRNGEVGVGSSIAVFVQLFFAFFSFMSYAAIQVVVAQTAPKHLIGSINGFVQMTGCVMRTIAPTFASSLFSFSIREQILGGYLVYVIIYIILLVGIGFSRALTDHKYPERST